MPRLEFTTEIAAPREVVWAFYNELGNLPKITPPWTRVTISAPPESLAEGTRFILVVQQPPIFVPLRWETVITVLRPPAFFVDEQGSCGPFAQWRHEHLLEDLGSGKTRLRDSITYRTPIGVLGRLADHLFLRAMLTSMFAYRHRKTREALEKLPD